MTGPARFSRISPFRGELPRLHVYQVPPPAIQFLTAWTEAADGVGLIRTLDESRGLVECWVMPDYEHTFQGLIGAVAADWPVQEIGPEFE